MRASSIAVFLLLPLCWSCSSVASRDAVGHGVIFTLHSPDAVDGGVLPRDYTGDGSSATLPLAWDGVPPGTNSFAVIMHHIPPEGPTKWYWVLYDIPASVRELPRNVHGIGTLGNNSVNHQIGYAPPHSKGPGPKTYVYTVYALSAEPQIDAPSAQVTRDVLLAAMQDRILAKAEMHVVYTRPPEAFQPRQPNVTEASHPAAPR